MNELLKTPRILWASLLFVSLFFCAASLYPIDPFLGASNIAFVAAPGICFVALMDAVMSFLLPASILKRWGAAMASKVTTEPDPSAEPMFREAAPKIRVLRADKIVLRRYVAVWQTTMILACAMSESIAIMGTVLSALGFWPYWSAPLGIAGVVLVAIRMPSERAVLQSASKVLNAKFIVS